MNSVGLSDKQKSIALFLARFFVIFLGLQVLILVADLSALENTIAKWEAAWINGTAVHNQIVLPTGRFEITPNCTGLVSAAILAGVVFGLPKPKLNQKMGLWIAGTIVLFVLNLIRIFVVLLIGKTYGVTAAQLAHEISWFATAVFILMVWLWFSKKIAGVKHVSELAQTKTD